MNKLELRLSTSATDSDEESDLGLLTTARTSLSTSTALFHSPGYSPGPPPGSGGSLKSPEPPLRTAVLHRKSSLGDLTSPPLSPEFQRLTLTKSNTLSRIHGVLKPPRRRLSETGLVDVDATVATKIRRWILGIVVVEFDVDDGPIISHSYPPLILFDEESENIAFSAFPDSPQFDQGSSTHSFRIRESVVSVPSDRRPASIDGFLYGFSHFTQKRDPNQKRGYQQRSVVILTHHPYPGLFLMAANVFGPLFEKHGSPMMEAACHNIASWPDMSLGSTMELGFLGSVLQVAIPNNVDELQHARSSHFKERFDPKLHILASSPLFIPPPLNLFEATLSHLWSIWECVVLGEPLLVFGSSPAETSQAIWWFRDLARPMAFGGDIRPYFTIHDVDHQILVNKLPPKAGLLLGVTNPFFERSCTHWPHVLSLGRPLPKTSALKSAATNGAPAGPAPGWKTKTHKRYISKDRALLKRLEDACFGTEKQRIDISLDLRQHFQSRTNELLIPLTRYLNTLIPTPNEVKSAPKARLRLKPFNTKHFMASLKAHGSTLPFKSVSKRTDFYDRWLKSSAFGLWLAQQEKIVQDVLIERTSLDRIS